LQAHGGTMGQKGREIWTAYAFLQPIHPKSEAPSASNI